MKIIKRQKKSFLSFFHFPFVNAKGREKKIGKQEGNTYDVLRGLKKEDPLISNQRTGPAIEGGTLAEN